MLSLMAVPAGGMSDPLTVYAVPLILALLGIVGVAIGAWIAARSALRSRLIDLNAAEAASERAFGIRAVAVVTSLGIATHHLIEDLQQRGQKIADAADGRPVTVMLELDPARSKQVELLTDEWRAVLAEAQFYTTGKLAKALYEFDQQRDIVVKGVNGATHAEGLASASDACAVWREYHARQVYRLFQIDKIQGRARIYRIAHVRRLRHLARSLDKALTESMKDGDRLVRAADDEYGAPVSRSDRAPGTGQAPKS
ncbi:hypothetical protein [Microbacterium arborescens]|uniref:hypothetical protein n=1 Tax=Microbacterium arborescens TaxID=33883 RepID=UPI0025A299B4|nr:hypothetical protein [Microbacterium arborescens]WJM15521.1 hypothetical protein QUC20_14780 [Microbacterium arborescens]